ncbi:type VI secretion system baseplate subunit TssG [Jannaschia seohaensis]|uniref:Type VI secretion system protein ImpH n=1 Tax=Jannaschia seohaensis TaxID=475081 RepID=A0A2Y9AWZ0_9RHOB|nr:type VI secretion system baseplate subunit TssG [Jannaschia seohaensis]PWJ16557.1 type VI secretion system protein ImpH [Jannaschia seohaensis]SSA48794.1 type VI secretion system protein ImpH [Jannaschia seohaensis]
MADDAGHPRPDLTPPLPQTDPAAKAPPAHAQDFFALLRDMETGGNRFGRAGGPEREPARLGQAPRLGFAASDVAQIRERTRDGRTEVSVNAIGLIGPEGPMPLHLTRWIISRQSNRWFTGAAGDGGAGGATADTSFLDLLNLLQHRMIALYWRAWADARPDVQIAHGDGGRITAMMRALAGLGLPGAECDGDPSLSAAKLRHATSLAQMARSPENLTTFLETVIGLPVKLHEFVGVWLDIAPGQQTRLGMAHARLGSEAVVGARVFDRQSRAELELGPLTRAELEAVLADETIWSRLRHAIRFAAGQELVFDLRLTLAPGEVPAARLGETQLDRTAWLAPDPERGARDLVFRRVTDMPGRNVTEEAA